MIGGGVDLEVALAKAIRIESERVQPPFDVSLDCSNVTTPQGVAKSYEGVPGVVVIVHSTSVVSEKVCPTSTRNFLNECEKVLAVTSALGGTSIVIIDSQSPCWASDQFARMIINATWDHIYTRYGQDPWAQPPKPGLRHLDMFTNCLLYTSPSPRDLSTSRMPSSA